MSSKISLNGPSFTQPTQMQPASSTAPQQDANPTPPPSPGEIIQKIGIDLSSISNGLVSLATRQSLSYSTDIAPIVSELRGIKARSKNLTEDSEKLTAEIATLSEIIQKLQDLKSPIDYPTLTFKEISSPISELHSLHSEIIATGKAVASQEESARKAEQAAHLIEEENREFEARLQALTAPTQSVEKKISAELLTAFREGVKNAPQAEVKVAGRSAEFSALLGMSVQSLTKKLKQAEKEVIFFKDGKKTIELIKNILRHLPEFEKNLEDAKEQLEAQSRHFTTMISPTCKALLAPENGMSQEIIENARRLLGSEHKRQYQIANLTSLITEYKNINENACKVQATCSHLLATKSDVDPLALAPMQPVFDLINRQTDHWNQENAQLKELEGNVRIRSEHEQAYASKLSALLTK